MTYMILISTFLSIINISMASIIKSKYDRPLSILTIGDSITEGTGSSNTWTKSWPAQLSDMLDNSERYLFRNLAVGGTTGMRSSKNPYWKTYQFYSTKLLAPDVVFIMFGTNDAGSSWNESLFIKEYTELIQHFQNLRSNPEVFILIPPPLYAGYYWGI